MAVKAGQILFDAEGFVIDRIQTGGVSSLNVATDKVQELGDFLTVGLVRDIPDLSFEIESLDVSTDLEALACNVAPTAVVGGTGATPTPTTLDFLNTRPIDVTSPFRSGNSIYNIVQGVVIPYLNLESVSYKYGLKANASETFSFRGDAIFYIPGVPVRETGVGGLATYPFTNAPAIAYEELGQTLFALSVWWSDPATGLYKRLFHQQDYTDDASGFTLIGGAGVIPTGAVVHYCYGCAPSASTDQPFYYGPDSNTPVSVKPAAIRSKDMDIYLGVDNVMTRLTGVQSYDATWKVDLQQDEEFGNAHYISDDFNVADVSGTIGLKGVDPWDVIGKIQQLLGVSIDQVAGALTFTPVQLEARLRNPDTHALLKTIYIPDAEFTAPPIQGKANTKLETMLKFDSLTGSMQVFDGERITGETLKRPIRIDTTIAKPAVAAAPVPA